MQPTLFEPRQRRTGELIFRTEMVTWEAKPTDGDDQLWKHLFMTHFASRARSLLDAPLDTHESYDFKQLFKIAYNWRRGYARSSAVELRTSVLDGRMPVDVALPEDGSAETEGEGGERVPQQWQQQQQQQRNTLVQFHGRFIFTASRTASTRFPAVHAFVDDADGSSRSVSTLTPRTLVLYYEARPHLLNRQGLRVTELRLDEARLPGGAKRLAVFYSSGQFAIFRFVPGGVSTSSSGSSYSLEWEEEYARVELPSLVASGDPADGVVLSRFLSPLLVTCSKDFLLGVWLISTDEAGGDAAGRGQTRTRVQLSQPSLRSSVCWWPVVLSLAADGQGGDWDTTESFKVTIAYSTPFFPSSWTVGVQEFLVRLDHGTDEPSSSSSSSLAVGKTSPSVRIVTRHATAVPTTQLSSSLGSRGRAGREETSVVTSIEHSAPWIVTSRSDNTIEVFRVVSAPTTSPPCSSPATSPHKTRASATVSARRQRDDAGAFGVRYHSTLYGHTAAVESVSVGEGGRCVSGGADGKVKVWRLRRRARAGGQFEDGSEEEGDEEEEEEGSDEVDVVVGEEGSRDKGPKRIRWLGFDQRRIVSVVGGGACEGVRVLSFE
jgi:hypothetical protein